jgi:hypothetical protein
MVCGACAHAAFVIDDRAYFAGIEHTMLDFETNGDGAPVVLPDLGSQYFRKDEYAGAGVRFEDGVAWSRFRAPSFGSQLFPNGGVGDALDAVGSWPTAIGSAESTWGIDFTTEVHAVGIGVVQSGFPGIPDPILTTTLTAFGADGSELGVVRLWDRFIDGGFGDAYLGGAFGEEYRQYSFGFLGLVSETPIARVEFSWAAFSIFDDLHFSAIPAPGAGVTLGVVGLLGVGRWRR